MKKSRYQQTLGQGFTDWLKSRFGWMFQANATTSIGTAYVYGDGEIPGWAILGDYDNGSAMGAGRSEYIWLPTPDGTIPVGMYRNGKYYAIHTDNLGSPRLMKDEQNRPVWQWPYSAFGNNKPTGVLKATPNPRAAITNIPVLLKATVATEMTLRFPGQEEDLELGMRQNFHRIYRQSEGRYSQADPIGLSGGLNRYSYVEGNPVFFTDPDGLTRRPGGPGARPVFPPLGTPSPTSPVGNTRSPIEVRPGTNSSGDVGGQPFSGHAFDWMQGRGIPPSAVTNTVLTGQRSPGSRPGTTQYYDPVNNVTVVVNSTTGNVITVRNGPPSQTCP